MNEKTGEQFKTDFLGKDAPDEVIASPFIDSLRQLGIDAILRNGGHESIHQPDQQFRFRSDDYDAQPVFLTRRRTAGLLKLQCLCQTEFAQHQMTPSSTRFSNASSS